MMNCPFEVTAALVTGDHTTGGARLVVDCNCQSFAHPCQVIVNPFEPRPAPSEGKGRKTAIPGESALEPHALTLDMT
jgi:hypothetical protein